MSDVGSTAEEPMVYLTLRWRGVDSNFRFRDALSSPTARPWSPRRRAAWATSRAPDGSP